LKKLFLVLSLLFQSSYASDAITIDSIFKNNNGFRNVTTLEFISSSGSRKYTSYPALIGIDDGEILVDSKTVALNETFIELV